MAESKKRKRFSIKEKISILNEVDKNIGSRKCLADRLGITTSTLSTIIKNRKEVEECYANCGEKSAFARKSIKTGTYLDVEEKLLSWFTTARGNNIPVSGPLLQEKALEIAKELEMNDFTASVGWLDRFKKRHNVVHKVMCGEKRSVDPDSVAKWKSETLPELIKGYSPSNIFNADETGLFYNLQPDKTLCFQNEKCHGGKRSKIRLTVLLAANSDGSEKLPPYVIGKSANPRCFKNIKTLPTKYDANKKSWMTAVLFVNWLKDLDRKMRSLKRKVILFIDQCPAHPKVHDFPNLKVVFFPANCTSELQPLDMGIIRSFKVQYRKFLIRKILDNIEEKSQNKTGNFLNILEAMFFVRQSWNTVTVSTISNCFAKAGFQSENVLKNLCDISESDDGITEWEEIVSDCKFSDYVSCDAELSTCENIHCSEVLNNSSSGSDEEGETEVTHATFKEAISSLDTLKCYLMAHDVDDTVFTALEKIDSEVWNAKSKQSKQTSIKDFFSAK